MEEDITVTLIDTKERFLEALREHPEWRKAVRREILGEELIQLPAAFETFVTNQEEFNRKVLSRFDRLESRQDRTESWQDRMERDIATLKNFYTETKTTVHAYLICEDANCRLERILAPKDLAEMARNLDPALSRGNRRSFAQADMIIEAKDSADQSVFLTVEISYTADRRDFHRATRNARYLTDSTGSKAIPVVVGVRYDQELQPMLDNNEFIWFEIDDTL